MRPARGGVALLVWAALAGWPGAAQPLPPDSVGRQGVTVSGRVATAGGTPLQSGAVLMNRAAGDDLALPPVDDVQFLPDGTFSFRHVAPGTYQIRARAQTTSGGVTLFAGYRVQVGSRDITGIHLVLRPGATVTGTIEAARGEQPPARYAGTRVRAPFVDGSSFADALTGEVHPDGSFRLAGVMEGEHFLAIEGLPHGWVLRQALWRGADLAETPFAAESGATIGGVRLIVSARATVLTGQVRDHAGQPMSQATVFIWPAASTRWMAGSRRFVAIETDAAGRYRHRGLPPGDYRVVAARDRSAMPELRVAGVVLHLDAGETRELDLVLGSGASPAVTAAR